MAEMKAMNLLKTFWEWEIAARLELSSPKHWFSAVELRMILKYEGLDKPWSNPLAQLSDQATCSG